MTKIIAETQPYQSPSDLELMIDEQQTSVKTEQKSNGEDPIRTTSFDANALLRMEFPPIKFAVDGIITEGLSLLAGKPKIGKSWLDMGLAVAVATGIPALGTIPVEQGDCLYIALEDNPRRLQSRLRAVLQGAKAPDLGCLTLWTKCPRLDAGGLDKINNWTAKAHKPRLCLIDVWTKIKPSVVKGRGGTLYDEDYEAVGQLQTITRDSSLGTVITHHTKKATEVDPLDEISGSTGLSGSVDTVIILKRDRGQADATLFATGREIPDIDWALQFDGETGLWLKIGEAEEYRMSKERVAIKRQLDDGPMKPGAVAKALGRNHSTIKNLMTSMAKQGDLINDSGDYRNP